MSKPVVSVVIPTYRRPLQLQGCLNALAAQTFREEWEIVVVDDGSPEPLQLEQIGVKTRFDKPHIHIIRQQNSGPAAARNHGVDIASGQLIALTDDDCRPEPNWLKILVESWRLNEQAMVGGTTINGIRNNRYSATSQLIVDLVYDHFNADGQAAYFLTSNNVLCSRDQYLALGGFDTTFPRAGAEDRDFCDRWRQQGWPLRWQKTALIKHYHHQNFRSFISLHLRYGRGAFLYQQKRRQRHSGSMKEDMNFHKSLISLLLKRAQSRNPKVTLSILLNLSLWQLANALGFALEAWGKAHSPQEKRD